jgi:hypothetical protein
VNRAPEQTKPSQQITRLRSFSGNMLSFPETQLRENCDLTI